MGYYANNASGIDPTLLGTFPYPPYYWWESGAAWGGMVDYRMLTGDDTWEGSTTEALLAQVGPKKNFIMPNQRFDTGNDDQLFWVFAAMSALEHGYPEMKGQDPSWLQIVENAFDSVIARWDDAHCGGGLRWQIYPENNGYDYKNAVSNGALFQVAARMARYTGEEKYLTWAKKVWNWSKEVGFITDKFEVYDGASMDNNCNKLTDSQWSYNIAIFMHGAANMYNITGTKLWADRLMGLANTASRFYSPYENATHVAYEANCEPWGICNTDQFSFKAYLARYSAKTVQLAEWTRDIISPRLYASAKAAARSCSGGADGVTCGTKWYVDGWDGTKGMGQQLSALETIQSLLVLDGHAAAPAKSPKLSKN
jgi:mannan endo-1,6-alpha-mannosidase